MSRKMIDYKVEDGTITSIDGYGVGGGNTIIFKNQDLYPPEKSYWTNNNNENLNKLNKAIEKGMNVAIYCYSKYFSPTIPYTIYRLEGSEGFSNNRITFIQDMFHGNGGSIISDSSGKPSTPYYKYYLVDPNTGDISADYQLINTLAMDVGSMVGVNDKGEFLRVGNNSTGNSGYLGIPNKKKADFTEGTYSYKLIVDAKGNRKYDWVKDQ